MTHFGKNYKVIRKLTKVKTNQVPQTTSKLSWVISLTRWLGHLTRGSVE